MDARTLFLMLYRPAHDGGGGPAARVLNDPSPEQMRIKLPGHNSIAWILWHIARGEDWGVNAMLRGEEQLLTRDNWNARLGISRLDFGAGMTEPEVTDLTAKVDLDALRAYFDAVTAETLRFVDTFDFDRLLDQMDVRSRLPLAPDAIAAGGKVVRRQFEGQTTCRGFLTTMALNDVRLHMGEADHVLRQITPGKEFP
jgi:hypothetical protein